MKFEPFGPFKLPRNNGAIDRSQKDTFWSSVASEYPSLPGAVGCYIFALKAAKGYKPWYVGKTEKQCFADETWNANNLLNYGEVIRSHKGLPMMYLLAKLTKQGRFAKPTKNKIASVAALEEMLIGSCLQRNSDLLNKKTTRHLRELQVPGYLNEGPGARRKNARALARLLNT